MSERSRFSAKKIITNVLANRYVGEIMSFFYKDLIGMDTLTLYKKRIKHEVVQRDIRCFRAFNGYVEAIVGSQIFRKDTTLKALEQVLDDRLFVRINRQYIVNLSFIEEKNESNIWIDGIEISVSRRRRKEFFQKNITFEMNYLYR